jgi:tight adherence protein B
MDWASASAVIAFLVVVTLIAGLWWLSATSRSIRDRLTYDVRRPHHEEQGIIREDHGAADSKLEALASHTPLWGRFTTLAEQAGYDAPQATEVLLWMGTFALVGGALAWVRMGGIVWGMLLAPVAGSLPLLRLFYKRHRRLKNFDQHFPDALDMMARSMRAGHALSGALQGVAEQMPDPAGKEFARISEEIRLGLDLTDALSGLQRRVPTEDTAFFCTAINIQRNVGGNLAEILDRLSEVIRERFKVLRQARVLSAQHKWTAICVGLSPVAFAVLIGLINPRYFDPLWKSPIAPYLVTAGLVLEAIGFLVVWRMAQIKV